MKLAKCVGLTKPVTVVGSIATVVVNGPVGDPDDAEYQPGWEGDLDQVVGETPETTKADGEIVPACPMTLADALGDHICHFEDLASGERLEPRPDPSLSDEALDAPKE